MDGTAMGEVRTRLPAPDARPGATTAHRAARRALEDRRLLDRLLLRGRVTLSSIAAG